MGGGAKQSAFVPVVVGGGGGGGGPPSRSATPQTISFHPVRKLNNLKILSWPFQIIFFIFFFCGGCGRIEAHEKCYTETEGYDFNI